MGGRIVSALAALAALAACGDGSGSGDGGCTGGVDVGGVALEGINVAGERLRLPPLGATVEVERPRCPDGGRTDASPERLTLRRIDGVPAEVALAETLEGRVETLYVGEGRFPQLPSHPLHRSRYRTDRAPDLTAGHRCRGPREQSGAVAEISTWEGWFTVRSGGRRMVWYVDAATRVAPEPVTRGERVTVQGVRCGQDLVARSIRQ